MTSFTKPAKNTCIKSAGFPAFSAFWSCCHTSFFFLGKEERILGGGGHLLDLNLGHGSAGASEVSGLGFGVLGVVVADGGFDGVFGKHGAVDWEGC